MAVEKKTRSVAKPWLSWSNQVRKWACLFLWRAPAGAPMTVFIPLEKQKCLWELILLICWIIFTNKNFVIFDPGPSGHDLGFFFSLSLRKYFNPDPGEVCGVTSSSRSNRGLPRLTRSRKTLITTHTPIYPHTNPTSHLNNKGFQPLQKSNLRWYFRNPNFGSSTTYQMEDCHTDHIGSALALPFGE